MKQDKNMYKSNDMRLCQFKFKLPEELIAQYPAPYRDEARLMVLHRKSGEIEHVSMPEENWVTEDVKPLKDMVIYYNGDMYDPHESAKGHMTVLMQAYYKYIPGTEFFSILRRFEANGPWFFAGGHLHDNPELLAYYGADPWHPYEMKQKIVQYIGGEKYVLEYPCVCYFPPYVHHCPLDIKETEKPAFWHSLAPTMSEYSKSSVKGLSGENGDAEVKMPW